MPVFASTAATLLNDLQTAFSSLSPARRERMLRCLREILAALDDDAPAAKYGNRHFGPASL